MQENSNTFNSLESAILRILEGHQGQENAISRDALFFCINRAIPQDGISLFRVSDRTIRKTIKHLITQHGVAIGSCHRGYFMAETSDEIEAVCRYYDSYGLSSLFVSSKLRKIEMRDYLGQLSLRFE